MRSWEANRFAQGGTTHLAVKLQCWQVILPSTPSWKPVTHPISTADSLELCFWRGGFMFQLQSINYRNIESPSRLMQISVCERRCGKNYRALSRTRFCLPAGIRESETKLFLEEEVWGPVSRGRASSNLWVFLHKSLHCPPKTYSLCIRIPH